MSTDVQRRSNGDGWRKVLRWVERRQKAQFEDVSSQMIFEASMSADVEAIKRRRVTEMDGVTRQGPV